MKQLTIVKIGGNIIDAQAQLDAFLRDFAFLEGDKILVHGGGKIATQIGSQLGISPKYVEGRRITDAPTLSLVTMVYGGLINKNITAQLQALGCNAIGLSGADGNAIAAVRRPAGEVDYGFAGDVTTTGVNVAMLTKLLEAGLSPVLAPLTHDGAGSMLNTNADTIAQETAKAFAAGRSVRLIYCLEKPGVLADVDDDGSVISQIDRKAFQNMRAVGSISAGMIPKLENAFRAKESGVAQIVIGRAEDLPQLLTGKCGTQIL